MTRTLKWIAALCVAAFSTVPAIAGDPSPVGSWQVSTGKARYDVTACGEDGSLLCAKLVWLAPDQRTKENMALLNTYVVRGAAPADANKWKGTLVFEGESYAGTMTLLSEDSMALRGCSGILCQSYKFTRI